MDEPLDHRFCCFCQDASPTGSLLLVVQLTQEVVGKSEFRVCSRCGPAYTDKPVGKNDKTGEIAVLQFEHDDFSKPEIQSMIAPLTEQIENMTCHVCGKRVDRGEPGEKIISPRDFATKMLRLRPSAVALTATCDTCVSGGQCSCCNESSSD
jgi:hypothetical protein